jgi:hypothetical protein
LSYPLIRESRNPRFAFVANQPHPSLRDTFSCAQEKEGKVAAIRGRAFA